MSTTVVTADYLDWRTQHGFTATFETMLTEPLVIHYHDEVFQGEGIARLDGTPRKTIDSKGTT